jgi:hypothetical protein
MACSRLSLETGGSRPNASAVRNSTFLGWPASDGVIAPGMCCTGKVTRVFSVREPSS